MKTKHFSMLMSVVGSMCISVFAMCFIGAEKGQTQKVLMSASWSYNYFDVEELTKNSDLIARVAIIDDGQCKKVNDIPMTYYTASVTTPIYGCTVNDTITIAMTGGIDDGILREIADDPLMKKTDDFLIFCRKNVTGTYTILSGSQGRMSIENGLVSSLNVSNEQVRTHNTDSNISVQNVPLDEFLERIDTYIETNGMK